MHRHVEHKHSTRKPPRKKKEPRDRRDTIPVAPRNKMEGDETPHDEKKMEGEGSYTAGRRYDEDATTFAKSGDVDNSARKAADDLPDDELLDGVPSSEEEIDDADTRPGYRH